jgi:alpha-tubulin suppressor-like RCC1 family protein
VFQNDTQRSGPAFGVGRNDFGQTNPASTTSPSTSFSALPAGGGATLTDAVSVAAGNGFALWTDHLGKVWSIGDNGNGKRGNGTTGGVDRVPVAAAGFGGSGQPKAVKVASFGLAVDVLDSNGDVWQWGQVVNNNSTLAVQSAPSKLSFPGASRIIDVSAGESFSVALDLSGKVYTWGKGDRGQLGTGTTNTSPYPAQIPSGTKAGQLPVPPANASVWVEAGRDFAVYTVSNPGGGVDVWTWGRGDLYQQANAKTLDQKSPVKVALTTTGEKVRSLSAGTSHALLLTTSNSGVPVLRWWGTQALGSSSQVAQTPTTITAAAATSPHVPISVTAGDSASFVASSDGTVASWGKGANGQLGTGATGDVTAPALTTIPGALPLRQSGVPVTMVSRAGATYAVVNADITSSPDMTGLPYSFGYYPVNPDVPGSSAQHGFTFTNVATRDLTGLTASILTDKDVPSSTSTEFAVTGSTCANPFPVSSTCTVTVSFAPTTTTGSTAYLVLATTNTGVPVLRSAVKLSGQGYTSQKGLTNYSLTVQGPPSVGGPGNVIDLRTLNPKLIPESIQETTGTASLTKLPLAELSLTKLPTSTASLTKISLTKLSLTKISLTKLSLTKISLTKLPVTSLTKLSLTKISLTKLPLQRLGGWEDLLQAYPNLAKIPVSSLTVADLVNPALNQPADPSTGLPLERVSLGDLDVRNSALANVSFLSLLQGGMRLGQYPVDWCTELPQVPNGGHCTDGSGLNRTLFELSLSNPIDIGLTSVGNVTVGQLRTDAQSASGNPLDDTAWGDILLASTTLSGTHVGDIALASIPDLSKVLDCSRTSCTSTAGRHLGDNDVVGALKPDAVFKDLGSALNPLKLMYLVEPFLDRSSFDWESLPRTAIPLAAYPNRYNVTASAMVNCDHAAAMTFGFALPSGFTYVPGTATLDTSPTTSIGLSDPTNPPSDSPDRGLVLSVPGLQRNGGSLPCVNDGFGVTVHLGVLPTSAPGSGYKATGDVRTSDLGPLSGTQAGNGITVTGVNQPPDDTPTGPVGREDTLILGHVNAGQTAQYVPVDVPEGKIIEATLSGLDANPDPATDLDLTLYYPKGAGAERALSGSGSPVQVPFGESQVVEPDRGHPRASASGGALQDVPLRTDRLVAAVSATRGHDLEQLSAIARKGDDSRHLLAITSFNGSSGDFTVRMRVLDPPSLASCGTVPRTVGSPASTTLYQHAGDAAGFRSTDSTVVLVNASRQQAYYGDSAGVLESAYQFTHSANGVKGQVLQVDSDPSVRAAYANWDAHPCDPLASNQVVRAINDLVLANVDTKKIKYVNVLGAHPVIPYAWLEDHTRDGSEREEAGDLTFKDGNPIAMASALGYFASDDPYGTFVPIAVLGQVVYSPQAVTGRIGEASADIKSQLSLFQTPTAVAAAGVADPRTASSEPRSAVVTDYDFLAPGGTRTANALTASGYAVDHTLSGAAARWTKADLDAAWLERSPMPAVAALNMHYDQYRALPAYGAATNSLNELYTARGDVDAAASLARRVVYTAGCHSALGVPDDYAIAGDDRAHDFAQAYGAKGLAVMVGNFGYGYADSDTVAYSARLQALFSERTSSTDLGTALVLAKRRYLATLSSLSPYDLKSMQQMVLWGVAQYRFPGVAAPGQAVSGQAFGPSSAAADPVTGLPSQAFSVGTSANELRFANPDGSSVYSNGSLTPPADDGTPTFVSAQATDPAVADHDPATVSSAGHPVLAAQFVDLPSLTDSSGNPLVVRSVVPRALTSVRTYASTTRFAAADSDHDLNLGDASEGEYPATLGHQWNLPTGDGWSSTFVMTPEQVFLDGTAPGHASVRLYSRSDWVALLGPPATPAPDSVRTVSAARTGTTTRYSVDITPAAGRQTTSVYVLALPSQGYGSWVRTTLQQDSLHPGHWTGEAAGSLGAFGVVSSNDGGWSAISNLKGLGWQPTDLAPGGDDFSNFVLPDPGPSGWYTSYPTSSTTPGWTAYVDGAPVAPTYTFADGDHLVRLQRPDGTFAVGHLEVKVDTVVPTVLITLDGSPAASSPTFADDANLHHVALRSLHPLSITATAGPSGYVLSTQGTAPYGSGLKVDTSALGAPPGGQVLSGSATSGAGLVGTATYLYRVVYGSASFVAPTQSTNTVLPVLAYQYAFQVFDGASPATEVKTAPTGSFAASFAADTGCAPPGSINLPSGIASGSPSYNGTKWVWSLVAPLGGCQKLTGRLNDGYTKITTLVVL